MVLYQSFSSSGACMLEGTRMTPESRCTFKIFIDNNLTYSE